MFEFSPAVTVALFLVGSLLVYLLFRKAFYVHIPIGEVLIKFGIGEAPKVCVNREWVFPFVHRMKRMSTGVALVEIDRRGRNGAVCKDCIRVDLTVMFFVRVNRTYEDIMRVANSIGCECASNGDVVTGLFEAKFSEGIKTTCKQLEFSSLFEDQMGFRDEIIRVIGKDLSGYVIEDVSIDYLEQTPISELDPNNVIDAEGIRRIKQILAEQQG